MNHTFCLFLAANRQSASVDLVVTLDDIEYDSLLRDSTSSLYQQYEDYICGEVRSRVRERDGKRERERKREREQERERKREERKREKENEKERERERERKRKRE